MSIEQNDCRQSGMNPFAENRKCRRGQTVREVTQVNTRKGKLSSRCGELFLFIISPGKGKTEKKGGIEIQISRVSGKPLKIQRLPYQMSDEF